MKELNKASGGPWDGNKVDEAYEEMLSNIFGAQAIQKFKKAYVGDYFDLLRDFETIKRTISTDTEGKMMFRIPASLKKCSETRKLTIEDLINKSQYRGQISWMSDKIRVEKVVARSLFDVAIGELTRHVELVLSDPQVTGINAILLVGGFGECELIKDSFEKKFRNKKLIVPADAGLAVLKGSVRFGHLPDIISLRVSRYTFGWSVMPEFDEKIHDKSKKVTHYGKPRCRDVFRALVQIGEEVPVGKEIRENGRPASCDQKSFTIEMYSSTEEQPKYVTDKGCTYLGKITVDLPDSDNIADKHFSVLLTFGRTELTVRVLLEKTNRTYETYVKYFE